MYDENGDLLHQIRMQGLQRIVEPEQFLTPNIPLAGVDWFEEAQMYSINIKNITIDSHKIIGL